jgi:hypothetical protein
MDMQLTLIESNALVAMPQAEAREKTDRIKAGLSEARRLLLEMYERDGWEALGYSSWREYGQAEFGYSERRIYQLMDAAKTERNLCTIVQNPGPIPEGQLRPLARLEPEQQRDAWMQVTEEAERTNGKITGAKVQRVADQMARAGVTRCPTCGKLYDKETFANGCPYCFKASRGLSGWTEGLPEMMIEAMRSPVVPEQQTDRLAIHYSSETPEHYTPDVIIQAALDCLDEIDLDPCANSHDDPSIPAHEHFTKEDDGLAQEWHGRVYMNPPYGREIGRWVDKLCSEAEAGHVTEAIALVPSRTDTQWWLRLRDHPVCLVQGRLTFVGSNDPAPFPSAVFYLGEDIGRFYRVFNELGDCWQRMMPGVSFGE